MYGGSTGTLLQLTNVKHKNVAVHYLNLLNEAGLHDAEIARVLNISRSAISNTRRKEGALFDDAQAIKIAEILGVKPLTVIADIKRHSQKEAAATFWQMIFEKEKNG